MYDSWQEKYNVPQSAYSIQAYESSKADEALVLPAGAKFGMVKEMDKKYEARVSTMFANVSGLRDVRDCVNPHLELNRVLT